MSVSQENFRIYKNSSKIFIEYYPTYKSKDLLAEYYSVTYWTLSNAQ